MTIKINTPNSGGDSLDFGCARTAIVATVTGTEVSSGEGKLEFKTTTGGTSAAKMTIAANGIVTFTKHPVITAVSAVHLNTTNGVGSTNTAIRRWTNTITNTGSDITYADSASLGGTFTINTTGVYSIHYSQSFNAASDFGISNNSNQLTTGMGSLTIAHILAMATTTAANYGATASWTGLLTATNIVRAQSSATDGSNARLEQFSIARVG